MRTSTPPMTMAYFFAKTFVQLINERSDQPFPISWKRHWRLIVGALPLRGFRRLGPVLLNQLVVVS